MHCHRKSGRRGTQTANESKLHLPSCSDGLASVRRVGDSSMADGECSLDRFFFDIFRHHKFDQTCRLWALPDMVERLVDYCCVLYGERCLTGALVVMTTCLACEQSEDLEHQNAPSPVSALLALGSSCRMQRLEAQSSHHRHACR